MTRPDDVPYTRIKRVDATDVIIFNTLPMTFWAATKRTAFPLPPDVLLPPPTKLNKIMVLGNFAVSSTALNKTKAKTITHVALLHRMMLAAKAMTNACTMMVIQAEVGATEVVSNIQAVHINNGMDTVWDKLCEYATDADAVSSVLDRNLVCSNARTMPPAMLGNETMVQ